MGAKIKTQKIPGPKINPKKIPCRISERYKFPERKTSLVVLYSQNDAGTAMNLHIVLNTPKNPFLNQATKNKIPGKFSYPKKSRNQKVQTQKFLRSSQSLEIRSTHAPGRRPGHRGTTVKWSFGYEVIF